MKAVAEAPSKAIITGEHFVVHGAWALAAALPGKVRVEVSKSTAFSISSDRFQGRDPPELKPAEEVVESMSREFAFNPRVKVAIKSKIPHGAGLGSSAATMVALAAALSRLNSLGLGVNEIVTCSMVGEREIHGLPSGIDSNICAHGGVILFRPHSRPRKVTFEGSRTLLVTYTGRARGTKGQIGKVSSLNESFPSLFEGLKESVSEVSLLAAEKLASNDMQGLGGLLTFNQAVLSVLGVSHPAIDKVVAGYMSHGAYGAKLTGAGGGGSVVAVAPKAKEKSTISGLQARGFETFRAKVPVEGVKSWLVR